MRASVVEKDAGVEALSWTIHVHDDLAGDGQTISRVLYHYVRLKVFDDKGKDLVKTIDLPSSESTTVDQVAARTTKIDGTVVELAKDAIFKRDRVRFGGLRQKVTSFALPAIEPGSIVEYRWREIRSGASLHMKLNGSMEFPVQKVTYYVKPLSREYTSFRMSTWGFNCTPSPMKLETNGFNSFTITNVPAFHDEPMMPSEPNIRAWILVLYREDDKRDPDKYWTSAGKNKYEELKVALKANNDVKQAAQTAVGGATSDEDKVKGMIRYLRQNIRSIWDTKVTDAQRAKILAQLNKGHLRSSADVLKSGMGTADEMNLLFAAMAAQVGLEARPALAASRDQLAFSPQLADQYFLDNIDMAVKMGEDWKVYDVSTKYLSPGMLSWKEEGVAILLSDPKKPVFIQSKPSPPEASATTRTAHLTLSEDGTLEGDVDERYTGHAAEGRRGDWEDESEDNRLEAVKKAVHGVFSTAEISAVHVEAVDDPEKPLEISYHVKIPGYAQRTSKRILLQPFYFQRGEAPMFSAGERRYRVEFPYAWKQHDDISIQLPAGFVLDNADNPGGMNFGNPGSYSLDMKIANGTTLICTRELVFGNKGMIFFTREAYPQIKSVFDEINMRDNHPITLRQKSDVSQQAQP